MKKYQELEKKVAEMQKEIDRLKAEENKLPDMFDREHCLSLLNNPNPDDLDYAFTWTDTPQGGEYWCNLNEDLDYGRISKLPDEATIQIQKWIILSYQRQFGD